LFDGGVGVEVGCGGEQVIEARNGGGTIGRRGEGETWSIEELGGLTKGMMSW
jgi:hypothetical protein